VSGLAAAKVDWMWLAWVGDVSDMSNDLEGRRNAGEMARKSFARDRGMLEK
jgi:hypothetical protein